MRLSDGDPVLDTDVQFEILRQLNHLEDWEQLLASSRYIVILGEAGTGKTVELKRRAIAGISRGLPLFFMDIGALSEGGPEQALWSSETARLSEWRDGSDAAYFLLDSVDEANLRQESLGRALRRLDAYVNDLARVNLVVSCRVSDWNRADQQAIAEHIARAHGEVGELRIVQLAPLDEDRIRRLALSLGVQDVDQFLLAVDEASARPYVARPLDVQWIVEHWNRSKTIGTLTDLVASSLTHRVEERRPKSLPPSTLSSDQALRGVQRLAGVAVLSGRWSIRVPDEAIVESFASDAIDPRSVLSEWSPGDIREILTRALFDECTYGRVRLHHRTIQEYLAARWLQGKIARGLSRRDLERLMFRVRGAHAFVPPHFVPVAAWLAGWDEEVREKLISLMPEALLQHGDPAALDLTVRERALSAYLSRYRDRERLYDQFDSASLRRFAPLLGDVVAQHLRRSELPEDARTFLLDIANRGRLNACAGAAVESACDTRAGSRLRCHALRAVAALLEKGKQRRFVVDLMSATSDWDQDVAGAFAGSFFPDAITPGELGVILRTTVVGSPAEITAIKGFAWSELPSRCPIHLQAPVLEQLVVTAEVTRRDRGWLLHAVQEMARVAIETMSSESEPGSALCKAISMIRTEAEEPFDGTAHRMGLKNAIASRPRVRRWLFWTQVDEFVRRAGRWPTNPFEMYAYDPLSTLGPADAEWLARDAQEHEDERARRLAFAALLNQDGEATVREFIEQIVTADVELRDARDARERRTRTPSTEFEEHIRVEQSRRKEERDLAQNETIRILRANLEGISTGTRRDILSHLCFSAPPQGKLGLSMEVLRAEFDEDIVQAAARGLQKCWRRKRPPYQFEEENRSTISGDVAIGIAGFELELANGLSLASLDDSQTEIAVRLAVRQFNALPDWFGELGRLQPLKVFAALRPVVEADLRLTDPTAYPEFLSRTGLPLEVRDAIADLVLEELEHAEPPNLRSLEDGLRSLHPLRASLISRVVELCEERIERSSDVERACVWWCTWVRIDPCGAVRHLDSLSELAAAGLTTREHLDEVVITIASRLGANWGESINAKALFEDAEALATIIPIIYRSVRVGEDKVNRTGRAGWIDERDNAQSFRNRLFSALAALGTVEASAALEDLAEEPELVDYRDELLERARRAPWYQAGPMAVEEALAWDVCHATPVRSAHDLFGVALDRFDDIRAHVERGERSPRELFAAAQEADFQKWIAQELENRNSHGYSVVREEEGDRKKTPDIRLHHSACHDNPVSVEVKIPENWSNRQLSAALERQLVQLYLRAEKSRHGVLLLCSRGTRRGKRIDLDSLISRLDAEAQRLVKRSHKVDALRVIGIDFR